MASIPSMPVVFTAALLFLLTFYHPASANHRDDVCEFLVHPRVLRSDELLEDEARYFCHPSYSNAYIKCVVGRPELSQNIAGEGQVVETAVDMTEVKEEKEYVCNQKTFFNSRMKACVAHPLSNCAKRFAPHPPDHDQLLCEAYQETMPFNITAVAHLICHDKFKNYFVACPINAAAAVSMKCAEGRYFSQALGECVSAEKDSECPIDWMKMEKRNDQKAGLMRADCPVCRCICETVLAESRKKVVYVAHPDSSNKFLTCVFVASRTQIHAQIHDGYCPPGLFWDDKAVACAYVAFRKPVPQCVPVAPVLPVLPVFPTLPVAPVTAEPVTAVPVTPAPVTAAPVTNPSAPIPPAYAPRCEYYYEFHPQKMNWYSAMRVCRANQGSLVTIPNMEIQSTLRDNFGNTGKQYQVWLGANDRNFEGNWEWVTGERFGFTNWYRGQPVSSYENEDCLMFNYKIKGGWSAEDCALNKPFVCQHLVCT